MARGGEREKAMKRVRKSESERVRKRERVREREGEYVRERGRERECLMGHCRAAKGRLC